MSKGQLLRLPAEGYLACLLFIGVASCGEAPGPRPQKLEEAWQSYERPEILTSEFNAHLESLPLQGRTDVVPWADSYWPNIKGGITARWQRPQPMPVAYDRRWGSEGLDQLAIGDLNPDALNPDTLNQIEAFDFGFFRNVFGGRSRDRDRDRDRDRRSERGRVRYDGGYGHGSYNGGYTYFPSREMVLRMNPQQLGSLSPAEKFDILTANYDYPLTRRELTRTRDRAASWYGLCHGWAAAAIQFREPEAVTMRSVDGVTVPFASSDIKALLAFAQQDRRPADATLFLGKRCNTPSRRGPNGMIYPSCKGVNAGSFHVIAANLLGLQRRPFVLDISSDEQVWNMPAYGFESRIVKQGVPIYGGAAPGTASIVEVETKLQYTHIVNPQLHALQGRSIGQFKAADYRYTLELDAQGQIIGGAWLTAARPDFIWLQTAADLTKFSPTLDVLYRSSIGGTGLTDAGTGL